MTDNIFKDLRDLYKAQWARSWRMVRLIMDFSGHADDPREEQIKHFGRYVTAAFYRDFMSGENLN